MCSCVWHPSFWRVGVVGRGGFRVCCLCTFSSVRSCCRIVFPRIRPIYVLWGPAEVYSHRWDSSTRGVDMIRLCLNVVCGIPLFSRMLFSVFWCALCYLVGSDMFWCDLLCSAAIGGDLMWHVVFCWDPMCSVVFCCALCELM